MRNPVLKTSVLFIIAALTSIAAVGLSACASGPRLNGTITEDGSLNVYPLADKLAEFFMDTHPGTAVIVKVSSTAAGIEAVNTGTVDIGGASRDLKPTEPRLITHLLCRDGIAVIVHPANPVGNLTREQIRDIFTGKITNWQQVGGADLGILIVTREADTSTRSVLEEVLLGNAVISGTAVIRPSNDEQRQAVMDDPQAIGYNPFATSLDGTVRVLGIDGVMASHENAGKGTYPLIRPLYFLTKTVPEGPVKTFIDFCLGSEGQQIAADMGYVRVK